MTKIISALHVLVWGLPAVILLMGVGLYFSFRLKLVQLRWLPRGLRLFFRQLSGKDPDSFRAFCTALGATVGTGNLVGVAGALCIGGPGAVFWMWLCGLLGMATKYAEAALSVRYRVSREDGYHGGPMYMMSEGLGSRFQPLAKAYCAFGVIAAFGVGNAAQIDAAISGVEDAALLLGKELPSLAAPVMGLLLAWLLGRLLSGGAERIGNAVRWLVPLAAAGYLILCMGVLLVYRERIPGAFRAIVAGAFDPRAVTGGALGSAFQALRTGCSRGLFTNEAGMGTAAIAHGSAEVAHPVRQGLMGIVEVFLDTIVICTMTALVILVSGISVPYGSDGGAALTLSAFAACYGPGVTVFLAGMLLAFAVAAVLGWSFYGGRCAQYLFGSRGWRAFALAQTLVVFFSSLLETAAIWQFSETVNGLMVIPNLITLALLSPELSRLTKEYKETRRTKAGGGNYADFHQCKPL